jgi:oligoribonuclease NrnB/cAMP/cGMP phosphodiesterase (DHH superfamily)
LRSAVAKRPIRWHVVVNITIEMDRDLKALLESWAYDPDDCVRVVKLGDGREVMQVRLPLGIEQYELDGRPDGHRPHHTTSLLDHHLASLEKAKVAGKGAEFRIDPDACVELFNEGVLYYYRYLHLFQLKDWPRTVRDTARNMQLFDFIRRYAAREEDKHYLEQWRPYVLRINAVAAAMIELGENDHQKALAVINSAAQTIEALPEIDEDTFKFERHRSLEALHELADEIEKSKPLTELEKLENQLQEAVTHEHYEHAAKLRDRIRRLRGVEKPA